MIGLLVSACRSITAGELPDLAVVPEDAAVVPEDAAITRDLLVPATDCNPRPLPDAAPCQGRWDCPVWQRCFHVGGCGTPEQNCETPGYCSTEVYVGELASCDCTGVTDPGGGHSGVTGSDQVESGGGLGCPQRKACNANWDCDASEYCEIGAPHPDWHAGNGVCSRRPLRCIPGERRPLCTLQGHTFYSPCEAAMAGETPNLLGACPGGG